MLRLKITVIFTSFCFFFGLAAPLYAVPKLDASGIKEKQIKIHKFLLGIYKAQNRQSKAIKEFPVLLNLTPEDAHLRFEYGLYLAKAGDNRHALLELNKAKRMAPGNPEIHSAIGVIYCGQKKYKEACDSFSDAIRNGGDTKRNKELYEKARKYVEYEQKRAQYEKRQKEYQKKLEQRRKDQEKKLNGGEEDDDW